MQHQAFLVAALILGASAQGPNLVAQPAPQQAARKPNVVLIMMDDLGYGDLGGYGAPDVRTPNVDRLAREGVRLTDAYANGPVCTPTRAALISGRYQQRVGLEWVLTILPADRERGLPVTGTSLPALLRANGYATGLVGKWHLGWRPEFGPNAHGFDEFYGLLSGARMTTIPAVSALTAGDRSTCTRIRRRSSPPASILAATDTRAPEGYRADGIDILPILRGEAPLLERHLFWRIARPNRQQRAVRSGRWKLLVDAGQFLLFDLGDDPGERIDLAARHPELVVMLKRLLAEWERDVDQ